MVLFGRSSLDDVINQIRRLLHVGLLNVVVQITKLRVRLVDALESQINEHPVQSIDTRRRDFRVLGLSVRESPDGVIQEDLCIGDITAQDLAVDSPKTPRDDGVVDVSDANRLGRHDCKDVQYLLLSVCFVEIVDELLS